MVDFYAKCLRGVTVQRFQNIVQKFVAKCLRTKKNYLKPRPLMRAPHPRLRPPKRTRVNLVVGQPRRGYGTQHGTQQH